MNHLFDNDIILLEPEHRYKLSADPNFRFKSITEVVSEVLLTEKYK